VKYTRSSFRLGDRARAVCVNDGIGGLENMLVLDGDGLEHTLTFRDPLMLPVPSESAH